MRHAFRPTLTTLALATLMAGCASSGSSSSGYYATALTNISGARVNLTGNRLDAWVGCNHLSANARPENATLEVGEIASTRMACQPGDDRREQVLAEFLKRGPKLDKTGDMWLLRDNVHAVVVHTNSDPQLTHASFGPNPAGRSADASATESALAMDRAIERETREQAASRPASVQQPQVAAARAVEPPAEPVNAAPERAPIGMHNELRTGNTVAPAPVRTVAQAPAVEPINTAPERAPIGLDSQIRTGDTVAPAPVRTVAQAPAVEPVNTVPERAPIGMHNELRTGNTVAPAPARTIAQASTVEPINTASERAPVALNDEIRTGSVVAAAPAPAAVQQAPAQSAPVQVAQSRPAPRAATTMALAPQEAVQATQLSQVETPTLAQQSPRLDLWQQMGADSWQLAPQHSPQENAPWQPAVETSRLAWFASLLKGDTTDNLPDMTVTAPREIHSYAVRESNQWVLYSGEPIDQPQEKVLSDEQHQKKAAPELTDRDATRDKSIITTSRLDESALGRGVRATTSRALNWLNARWQA
ncbi:META domain-containing protein [uncultured Kushneria sp.]|uniref:META domain-containing protein n=1 Tax=uncultured Kushneria sp. TaxID=905033 RepID=UPI0026366DDF|nr:META domain-containing protein [uncultured Kushneria sp.]